MFLSNVKVDTKRRGICRAFVLLIQDLSCFFSAPVCVHTGQNHQKQYHGQDANNSVPEVLNEFHWVTPFSLRVLLPIPVACQPNGNVGSDKKEGRRHCGACLLPMSAYGLCPQAAR